MIDFGKKCIILTRVSTDQQDYQFQLDALYRYAEELGLEKPLADISTKESGFRKMESKDGFKKVIDFLKEHDCRIVLCTELSRLAREKFILEQIKEWFVINKIQLYVKDIGFKLFNNNGEVDMTTDMVFSVYASMAQSEMREKKKRMSRGLGTLLSSGYSVVGPTAFGYSKRKTSEKINGKYRTELYLNEEQARQVKDVFEWALYGIDGDKTRCSVNDIVKECIARGYDKYLTSPSNVKKCLNNEGYTGSKTTHNRRKNPAYWEYGRKDEPRYIESNSHIIKYPPIISKELFNAVKRRMHSNFNHIEKVGTNTYADKSRSHTTLLAKILVCPICGCFLVGNYRQREDRMMSYYRCSQQHDNRSTYAMPLFDTAIWSFCKSNWNAYNTFLKKASGTDTTEIEQRIANLYKAVEDTKRDREEFLEQAFSYGKVSSKRKEKIDEKVREYDDRIADLYKSIVKEQQTIDTIKRISELQDIQAIVESSKLEMKKYIQTIVREAIPIYKTSRTYVIKVSLNHGIEVPYTHQPYYDIVGEPPVYLIVDGIQGSKPKLKHICSPDAKFNDMDGSFYIGDNVYTLQAVIDDTEDTISKTLPFQRLDIYNDDIPKTL